MSVVVRHALVQWHPVKRRYQENLDRLGEILSELGRQSNRPRVLALPEAALTGYFLQGGVQEVARTAAEIATDLHELYSRRGWSEPLDLCLGFYERHRQEHHNSALYVTLGAGEPIIRHVHRKLFLPTYGVFDEERFTSRGSRIEAFDTSWGRAAILICEDAWHSLSATIAALKGAEIIYVPTASPGRGLSGGKPQNVERWNLVARGISAEHGVFTVTTCLAGFEGGKGLGGGSVITAPGGTVLAEGPVLHEAIIEADLELAEIARSRFESPLLADLKVNLPELIRGLAEAEEELP